MKFYGLADAHGLESFMPVPFEGEIDGFVPDPKVVAGMSLRADANVARHSIVYMADIDVKSATEIKKLLDSGEEAEALILLKERASEVNIRKKPGAQKSWKLIPDPSLDANQN